MRKMGKSLEEAVEKGLRNWAWRDGVTLVQYDDGSFEAIPPGYLTEIIWVGYEHVERDLGNLRNRALDAGLDFPLTEPEVRWLTDCIRDELVRQPATDVIGVGQGEGSRGELLGEM
ncbi:MAG: hypothetical protein ACLFV5_04085 [Anaerolineales bacterium]